MKKRKQGNGGLSVSHGSNRLQDVIPDLICECNQLQLKRVERAYVKSIAQQPKEDYTYTMLEQLADILNLRAPYLMYFGVHPGNSSDYGYWLNEDWNEYYEGIVINARGTIRLYNSESGSGGVIPEIPKGYTGRVMQISDHGNMTLYRYTRSRQYVEWAIV